MSTFTLFPPAWCLGLTLPRQVVSIDDLVRGTVRWDVEATLGDFILLRSTGVPVYNFCVAVDDALMGITTVARAEEHLTNTVTHPSLLSPPLSPPENHLPTQVQRWRTHTGRALHALLSPAL